MYSKDEDSIFTTMGYITDKREDVTILVYFFISSHFLLSFIRFIKKNDKYEIIKTLKFCLVVIAGDLCINQVAFDLCISFKVYFM